MKFYIRKRDYFYWTIAQKVQNLTAEAPRANINGSSIRLVEGILKELTQYLSSVSGLGDYEVKSCLIPQTAMPRHRDWKLL